MLDKFGGSVSELVRRAEHSAARLIRLLLLNLLWLMLILPSTILAWRDTTESED